MGHSDSGRLSFEFDLPDPRSARGFAPDTPLGMLVVADRSGRRQREPLATRRSMCIDCERLGEVLAGCGAALKLVLASDPEAKVRISLRSLDDLHPDRLLKQLPHTTELLSARRLL